MPQDELNAIETKLRRCLMPVAMRESATDSIHAMLDELAGPEATRQPAPGAAIRWHAAAAAITLLGTVWLLSPRISDLAFLVRSPVRQTIPTPTEPMHLMDESTRLSWVSDEGWIDDPDGGALRALRLRVVEEDRLFDSRTGVIVHVTSPREEILLMPISSF